MDAPFFTVEPSALSDAAILQLWDVAESLAPALKSREILRSCLPADAFSRILQAPLGHANVLLLRIRQKRFGSRFHILDRCQHCAETIEFSITAESLLEGLRPPPAEDRRELPFEAWTLQLRPLCLLDLIELLPDASPEANGRRLMARTVTGCSLDHQVAAIRDLPEPAWETIARCQHEWDPAAEILFRLSCPACRHIWESSLDPGSYLWLELAAQARTLQAQIHTIASTYGWRESEILALSPERRAAYVALIVNGPSAALTALPRPARTQPT
jgi:hypothetical protein